MPFLHKHCKTDHYNSNKTVKIKPKEGYVRILTNSGCLYEGNWKNDKTENFGILAKKSKCMPFVPKYRGNWHIHKRHGQGNGYYKDLGYYVGQWKNNMRSGYGKMWYPDGSFYAGDWKCDKRWGQGLFVDVTGDRYEGSWMKNKRHGIGILYHLSTGQMQAGAWIEDTAVCSTMEDIPFRQTTVFATPYPIQEIELKHPNLLMHVLLRDAFSDEQEMYRHITAKESIVTAVASTDQILDYDINELREKYRFI